MLSFSGSGIKITGESRPYLELPIGSNSYVCSFVAEKVKGWSKEVVELCTVGLLKGYIYAFMHGLFSHWKFVSQTVLCMGDIYNPLEDAISQLLKFFPPSDSLRYSDKKP